MITKSLFATGLATLTTLCAQGAFIQLTPFGAPPGGLIDTNYIEFSSNSSEEHFGELDSWFVAADLILTAESGQNNTGAPQFATLNTTLYQYMVVRYEKNGPDPDLISSFALNGETSVTKAQLDATDPDHVAGYDHKQVYLFNASIDSTTAVPEGGVSLGLLLLTLGGLGVASRFRTKSY